MKRTQSSAIEEAKQYKTRNQIKKEANSLYQYLCKKRIVDDACTHMKCGRRKYTDSELMSDAKRFNSRNEWQLNSKAKYQAAKHISIDFLNICCEHMPVIIRNLSDEQLHEIALKFNTRMEFINNDPSAHRAACKRGIVDNICSHMIRAKTINNEKNILYYISIDNGTYYKIGITSSSVGIRFRGESLKRIKIIFEKKLSSWHKAKLEELKILIKYKPYITKNKVLRSGNTEIFTFDVLGLDV